MLQKKLAQEIDDLRYSKRIPKRQMGKQHNSYYDFLNNKNTKLHTIEYFLRQLGATEINITIK